MNGFLSCCVQTVKGKSPPKVCFRKNQAFALSCAKGDRKKQVKTPHPLPHSMFSIVLNFRYFTRQKVGLGQSRYAQGFMQISYLKWQSALNTKKWQSIEEKALRPAEYTEAGRIEGY